MVVAGPGTGKTQVLALRAANILKRTQMRPSNILCLTFSVSGATAMRERLRSLIGADAYGMKITTVHGFCNEVIQDHPEVFRDLGDLQQASDMRRIEIINAFIAELPSDAAIINPRDRYARSADILKRISDVKREGISLDRLRDVAALYSAEMDGKSRAGTKADARNRKQARQYGEFVSIFAHYQASMERSGLYDYDDMILWVTRALGEEDWLRAKLQERYQYILVDEYQDLNGAQNAVIRELTSLPESLGDPNLFVVGDDDQAIYRFQGANVAGMLQFRERFPACPVLTLTRSFRSTQQVLDAAGSLIARNAERLVGSIDGITKDLTSHAKEKQGPTPALVRAASDSVEPFALAEEIRALHAQSIPYEEIAVLCRTNADVLSTARVLEGLEIPVELTGSLDLLTHPKVRECIAMLYAVHSHSDGALSGALGCASFNLHPADVPTLLAIVRSVRKDAAPGPENLHAALTQLERSGEEWGIREQGDLICARDLLFDLQNKAASMTLPRLLESLLTKSGLLSASRRVNPVDLAALQEFFTLVSQRCAESLTYDLASLLHEWEAREKYGLRLEFASPHLTQQGVQVMTAHASKGLEFTAVILAKFIERHWGGKSNNTRFSLPDHLLFAENESDESKLEDERRLAYVALTRARKHVLMSAPMQVMRGERMQDVSPSQFFSESGDLPEREIEAREPEKALRILLPAFDLRDEHLQTFLRRRLETFELSPTSLNKFLRDPELFLREDLLLFPQARNVITAYGTAVHRALQEWALKHRSGFGLPELLASFRGALEREVMTQIERKDSIHMGERALTRYFEERLSGAAPEIYAIERAARARSGSVPLVGKMDRIDLYAPEGAHVHVIDYKTGATKTEKDAREKNGGDNYRQLVFYKLLTQTSPSLAGYEAQELSLDYIGDGEQEPRRLTFSIPQQDVEDLKKTIDQAWTRIVALDFGQGGFKE